MTNEYLNSLELKLNEYIIMAKDLQEKYNNCVIGQELGDIEEQYKYIREKARYVNYMISWEMKRFPIVLNHPVPILKEKMIFSKKDLAKNIDPLLTWDVSNISDLYTKVFIESYQLKHKGIDFYDFKTNDKNLIEKLLFIGDITYNKETDIYTIRLYGKK